MCYNPFKILFHTFSSCSATPATPPTHIDINNNKRKITHTPQKITTQRLIQGPSTNSTIQSTFLKKFSEKIYDSFNNENVGRKKKPQS